MVVRRNARSEQDTAPSGSWSSRLFTAGVLLAVVGFFAQMTVAAVVGTRLLWLGGALVLGGLLVWATQKMAG